MKTQTSNTVNGINYTTFKTDVKGQPFTILVATGKMNYISVSKDMGNRNRASLGKEFKTFTDAANFYKSAEIKTALMMIELNFNRIAINN